MKINKLPSLWMQRYKMNKKVETHIHVASLSPLQTRIINIKFILMGISAQNLERIWILVFNVRLYNFNHNILVNK